MNKRIDDFSIEAAEYADMYFDDNTDAWMHFYSDKFAELIINECIDVLNPDGDLTSMREESGRRGAMNMIKEHFGIK